MKSLIRWTLIVVAAGLLTGCGERKPRLHLYTWADYFKPELIKEFEKKYKCRVVIDTFDSNEVMLARIQAGATGFDLITPSSYMVRTMHQLGMLQQIDPTRLANIYYVDPEYLAIALDPEMDHSVPYMLTNTGFAYRKSRLEDVEPSWGVFGREDIRGRATMLNDMRETLGAALKYLGYSLNSVDEGELAEARDVVIGWKRNLAKFENEQYKYGLDSGEFILVHGYNGDILQAMEENDDIAFVIPQEGTSISCDDFVIPVTARSTDLAYAFIDFFLEPANAARNTEYILFLAPNEGAYRLLSEDILNNPSIFMKPEIRKKSEVIDDVGEALALYTRMWDQVRAAD
ncbi:MAG TPA: spermidine/putrescine ABC transporter substrate-binding protein [Kiritimatiellia bacterium]|nr:spermidine/putrescine ABC transporter substrate-binding protein [Kiritimatiellia bacterium]